MRVGSAPIPQDEFNESNFEAVCCHAPALLLFANPSFFLPQAIRYCLLPEIVQKAKEMAKLLAAEKSVDKAVNAFHRYLPLDEQVCVCWIFPLRMSAYNRLLLLPPSF